MNEQAYAAKIWEEFALGAKHLTPGTVAIVILPDERAGVFAAVKHATDFHGIHSICVLENKVYGNKTDKMGRMTQKPDGHCAPAYHADLLCTRGQEYMRGVSRALHGQPWWGLAKPQDSASIADQVARGLEWNGGGAYAQPAGRSAPWNPKLDKGMFYI
jgi:hypothetical protein